MVYKDQKLEKIGISIPYDLMMWVRENGVFSEMVRSIIDKKMGLEVPLNNPEYKKPRRPTRGRPRKDEDPNYVPPAKKPRGRPRKNADGIEAKSTNENLMKG